MLYQLLGFFLHQSLLFQPSLCSMSPALGSVLALPPSLPPPSPHPQSTYWFHCHWFQCSRLLTVCTFCFMTSGTLCFFPYLLIQPVLPSVGSRNTELSLLPPNILRDSLFPLLLSCTTPPQNLSSGILSTLLCRDYVPIPFTTSPDSRTAPPSQYLSKPTEFWLYSLPQLWLTLLLWAYFQVPFHLTHLHFNTAQFLFNYYLSRSS